MTNLLDLSHDGEELGYDEPPYSFSAFRQHAEQSGMLAQDVNFEFPLWLIEQGVV